MVLTRRSFLATAAASLAATRTVRADAGPAVRQVPRPGAPADDPLRLKFSLKYGMVGGSGTLKEKLQLVRDIGYDGIELDSPNDFALRDVRDAIEATGLPVEGVVDSIHWRIRLSDPDQAVREQGRKGLETAIRDADAYGGSSVLLVPGRVADAANENQQQCWDRSIAEVRKVLPIAAELGVHVLIENVWNGFCYVHDGPADQTADLLADYVDAFGSPWVGVHFDIGNHQKYGRPGDWARRLGRRIVKLDVKDWGRENGFCKIGDGDVDWADVRKALREIRYTGWAAAEVQGGDADALADVLARMRAVLTPS